MASAEGPKDRATKESAPRANAKQTRANAKQVQANTAPKQDRSGYPGKGLFPSGFSEAEPSAWFFPVLLDAFGEDAEEHVMLYLCTAKKPFGKDFDAGVKARIEQAARAFVLETFQMAYGKTLDAAGAATPPVCDLLDAASDYAEARRSRSPGRDQAMQAAADRFAAGLARLLAGAAAPRP